MSTESFVIPVKTLPQNDALKHSRSTCPPGSKFLRVYRARLGKGEFPTNIRRRSTYCYTSSSLSSITALF